MAMENQSYHYHKIAQAISYIDSNFKNQPSLDSVAGHIHLSPYHFQRLFKDWVGISPKKYLQFISSNYAKALLKKDRKNLYETAYETGFSGTSRLHDLFITLEGMTPGEFRNGGANLIINYSFAESPFGDLLVASTGKGICHMSFVDNYDKALANLQEDFPNASYIQRLDRIQQNGLFIFQHDWSKLNEIKLHLKGTDFQLKVWETLLSIPFGGLSTYGKIARLINNPRASRAVGTAIGNNPVAYLIPCHRVILQSGSIGDYHWDPLRKKVIMGWEASVITNDQCNSDTR